MSIDDGRPNAFRVLADKPTGEVLPGGAIRTDDGVVHQRPPEGWPPRGISYTGGWPDGIHLGTAVADLYAGRGLITFVNPTVVERPSRPAPVTDDSGSAAIAAAHRRADRENPMGNPLPHAFPQADQIVFHDPDQGDQTYDVVRQPDKYVAGDTTGEQQVTAEVYAAGDTEVEWFYTLQRVTPGQEN